MEPLLLSRYEAASLLAISFVLLDRHVKDGKIEPVRIGRRVLFTHAALGKFIRSQKKAAR